MLTSCLFLLGDTFRLYQSRTLVASLPLFDLIMRQYLHSVFTIHVACPTPDCCSSNDIPRMASR